MRGRETVRHYDSLSVSCVNLLNPVSVSQFSNIYKLPQFVSSSLRDQILVLVYKLHNSSVSQEEKKKKKKEILTRRTMKPPSFMV
jgi:hypothetical protein